MDLFKNFDIEHLIERILAHIDLEAITREVMADLVVNDPEIYFVVRADALEHQEEFVGMAYSMKRAKELARQPLEKYPEDREIYRLDIGKAVKIMAGLGAIEKVHYED